MLKFNKIVFLAFFVIIAVAPSAALAAVFPNDPNSQGRWWWENIGATNAWETVTGSSDVIVAVIDTAIDIKHPDLKNNIWINKKEKLNGIDDDGNGFIDDVNGWDFVDNDNDPSPTKSIELSQDRVYHHGTLIAGIIGADGNNKKGVAGVNWDVSIMPLRGLHDDGTGHVLDVNGAIDYAIENGASIINLSFVTEAFDKDFQKAISKAYHNGVLVVTSVGNDGKRSSFVRSGGLVIGNNLFFPPCFDAESAYSFVFAVGATDINNKLALFSNYGVCVDMLAPGVGIESTTVYDPSLGLDSLVLNKYQGTSISAPFVTGVAALLKVIQPSWRADELINALRLTAKDISSANPGKSGDIGVGLLDVAAAVKNAMSKTMRYPIHTINDQSGFVRWQAFDKNFKTGLQKDLPIKIKDVAGWDVFDYDRDLEDEIILVEKHGTVGTVKIFNMYGILEEEWTIDVPLVGKVLISPMRPHDIEPDFAPGIGLLFSSVQKVYLASYDIRGKEIGMVETPINGRQGVGHLDIRWSRRSDFFVVAQFSTKALTVYEITPKGEVVSETKHELNLTRRDVARRPAQFYYDDFYEFRDFEMLYTLPKGGLPAVTTRSVNGQVKNAQLFNGTFKGGVKFDVGDWDNDGKKEIVAVSGPGASPLVRIYNSDGIMEAGFRAGPSSQKQGLDVRIAQYR